MGKRYYDAGFRKGGGRKNLGKCLHGNHLILLPLNSILMRGLMKKLIKQVLLLWFEIKIYNFRVASLKFFVATQQQKEKHLPSFKVVILLKRRLAEVHFEIRLYRCC